ncbi:MAG: ATP-binding cassette domain-containing protein, partial [Ignavibacteria bacterium]|nr:ATP-binding cassette domain-containing protein [Ignavibacteria bacterium]
MNEKIISIENLVKRFPVGDGEFTALNNINLSFNKGEFAGIIGPSGSGKTTLLNIIGSLDKPSEGTALVMGKNISNLTHKESA